MVPCDKQTALEH